MVLYCSLNRTGGAQDGCFRVAGHGVTGAGAGSSDRMSCMSKTINDQMCAMARQVVT